MARDDQKVAGFVLGSGVCAYGFLWMSEGNGSAGRPFDGEWAGRQ